MVPTAAKHIGVSLRVVVVHEQPGKSGRSVRAGNHAGAVVAPIAGNTILRAEDVVAFDADLGIRANFRPLRDEIVLLHIAESSGRGSGIRQRRRPGAEDVDRLLHRRIEQRFRNDVVGERLPRHRAVGRRRLRRRIVDRNLPVVGVHPIPEVAIVHFGCRYRALIGVRAIAIPKRFIAEKEERLVPSVSLASESTPDRRRTLRNRAAYKWAGRCRARC